MSKSPEKHGLFKVGQNILLLNSKGEILIVQEKYNNTDKLWNLPGGRLHEGEDWEKGLRREVEEELGVVDFQILGIHSVRTWVADFPHYTNFFVGRLSEHAQIKVNYDDIAGYSWTNKSNIDNFVFQSEGQRKDILEVIHKYGK